jgi:hypothetical protein
VFSSNSASLTCRGICNSLEIFNLEDQDHSGCIDLMEYHHMLYVLQ